MFGSFQNFKDRFLSRSGGRIESVVLSAYGKLPIYKDYIQWECHRDGQAEFKRWLDEAFGLPWEEFDGKNVPVRGRTDALLLLPGGRWTVAATFWPSADEGHLRRFPFVLFTVFSRGTIVGRGLRAALLDLEPVWQCFEREYLQLQTLPNIEALYSYLQRTNPVIEPPQEPEISEPAVDGWMEAFAPQSPQTFRMKLEENLREVIRAYRGYPEGGDSLAACFPLAPAVSVALQAEIWAGTLQQNLKKCPLFPSAVIHRPEQDAAGEICLVWRELQREDSRLFGDRLENYDLLENLCATAVADDGADPEPTSATLEQWIADLGK